jgi:hypothetical protein
VFAVYHYHYCSHFHLTIPNSKQHHQTMPKLAYLLVLVTCCTIQALPACPIFDGSAPNSAACICEQGTEGECAAGDYCLKGGDQPCSYFPRCRARNVNWNTCLRCSPTNDFDCAVCKEGTFLYDGDCLDVNSDKIVSNGLAFAAILDDGSVQAWGDKEFGGEMIQGTGTCAPASTSSPPPRTSLALASMQGPHSTPACTFE